MMSERTAERGLTLDTDDKIIETYYGDRCYDVWITLGYAYFSEQFSKNYIDIVSKDYDNPKMFNKYWADIQDENLDKLYMYAKKCDHSVINEFDSLEELRIFDKSYVSDTRWLMASYTYFVTLPNASLTDVQLPLQSYV